MIIESVEVSRVIETPTPTPGRGEVLVKVDYVGLCGSDLNTFMGVNPLAKLPRIPGHEIAGTVVELGEGVQIEGGIGARVVVVPYTTCGTCSSCRKGRVNACRYNQTMGVQKDGGMSEMLVVPVEKVIVNNNLPPQRLALVEPLSVGFHAAARGSVGKGDRVVVLGCGMIGVGAIMGAAARGAEVIAVDLGSAKKDKALAFGAAHFVASGEQDLDAIVNEVTGGDGADVVIEAVGVPDTFVKAVDLACFAGRVVYVGYSKAPVSYNTSLFNLKELDIHGSRNATRADFEAVISHLEGLGDVADDLISKMFPLSDAAEALPHWLRERADTFKVMVKCS
ncbi:zinc-binding alcohol dehydrogenase family protein [Devosia algicola]|uniref:Zinc-binding alcohol dehydrogenase family protein n=1 Tax=Devosia algicola TaxID=3026418 RepID=A0ABY7YSN7_9HYPH|nr:zinc-binding alcohol dehydrogenase family protein [Devosia algicola]WDR04261.1 zinc-binding alcohol dehydrogenase family protein [Devosia algicola]